VYILKYQKVQKNCQIISKSRNKRHSNGVLYHVRIFTVAISYRRSKRIRYQKSFIIGPRLYITEVYLTPLLVLSITQFHDKLIIPPQSGLCILYTYNFCRLIRSLNNIGCKLDNLLFLKFL